MKIKLTRDLPISKEHQALEGKEYEVDRTKGDLAFVKDENGNEFGVWYRGRGKECTTTGYDDNLESE